MDHQRAQALLAAERTRVQSLLDDVLAAGRDDRSAANETGDMGDPAEPLTAEAGDDVVAAQLQDRLEAIGRAEKRLEDGTFGQSVKSGQTIPDERLEADPAAELTVEEAGQS